MIVDYFLLFAYYCFLCDCCCCPFDVVYRCIKECLVLGEVVVFEQFQVDFEGVYVVRWVCADDISEGRVPFRSSSLFA